MSIDQKKELALFLFYRRLQVHKYKNTTEFGEMETLASDHQMVIALM